MSEPAALPGPANKYGNEWLSGNAITLLENGDEFFPRVLSVIETAVREIFIETFILGDDVIGEAFRQALIRAANRGVWVSVLADGWGSYYLPEAYVTALRQAGVHFHFYEPGPKWLRSRLNILRRMHRKLVVVDGTTAFIGGINLCNDHHSDFGANYKQDYGAIVRGPVVSQIRNYTRDAIAECSKQKLQIPAASSSTATLSPAGDAGMLFLARDNTGFRTIIENQYIEAIQRARHRISIANAYFFPGYRLLKALRDAARRGVSVRLLIQGKLGSPVAKHAAGTLYDFLVESDIEVYEYWAHQFHGKIAAIDTEWATIGSSNLDPFSLCFNLEANVFVHDRDFNTQIHSRVDALIERSEVRKIDQSWLRGRTQLKWLKSVLVYHFLRHFPGASGWLPRLEPKSRNSSLPARPRRNVGEER